MNSVGSPAAGFDLGEDESELVVDTFVQDGHTTWVGGVRSSDGNVAWSGREDVRGGLHSSRAYEGEDAQEASRVYSKILNLG